MHGAIFAALAVFLAVWLPDWSRIGKDGFFAAVRHGVGRAVQNINFRRVIWIAGVVLITWAVWQIIGLDTTALMFAGDAMTYLEIASGFYLMVARGHVRQATRIVAAAVMPFMSRCAAFFRTRRGRRPRLPARHDAKGDDADPSAAQGWAPSLQYA
jgi:hypothetical protein